MVQAVPDQGRYGCLDFGPITNRGGMTFTSWQLIRLYACSVRSYLGPTISRPGYFIFQNASDPVAGRRELVLLRVTASPNFCRLLAVAVLGTYLLFILAFA
jgi:hypothetical protein